MYTEYVDLTGVVLALYKLIFWRLSSYLQRVQRYTSIAAEGLWVIWVVVVLRVQFTYTGVE